MSPLFIIIYIALIAISLYLIYDELWDWDRLVIIIIIISGIIGYLFFHFMPGKEPSPDYETGLIGDFSLDILIYISPGILILGLIALIRKIAYAIKKRS